MQETQQTSNTNTSTASADSIDAGSSTLHRTARKISQRTTDLIAIAIVSIGVLTVSGRLTEWWNTDPSTVSSPVVSANRTAGPAVQWGNSESAVNLLASEYPVQIERRILFGDQGRVDGILRNRIVNILESEQLQAAGLLAAGNHSDQTNSTNSELQRREARLIELLDGLPPVESKKGAWNLYRLDRPDNPVPGTFLIATQAPNDQIKTESLAAWAIAIPRNQSQWTSFIMTPTTAKRTSASSNVPVPKDARLILSLRADSDDELAVFQKLEAQPSDIDRWVSEISSQLADAGWQQTRPWQQSVHSATARFEHPQDEQHIQQQALEIAISIDRSNKLTGTANVIVIPEMELVHPGETQN